MDKRKLIIINGGSMGDKEIYGVQRNAIELLYEMDKIIESGSVKIVIPENGYRKFEFKNIEIVALSSRGKEKFKKFVWNHIIFPNYVHKQKGIGVDLVLALPLWGCDIVAIYDCIAEIFPENSSTIKEKLSRSFYFLRVKRSLKKCKFVITDSNSAKEDICKIYKYDPKKVFVIPCGWQHFNRVMADYSIIKKNKLVKDEFFFSLGSRYRHKNFQWIAEAAKQNPQYKFVVSGSNRLNSSDSNIECTKNLVFTGYLSDAEVKALMSCCRAFIQPSLYEGFGIPPMEAMSVGARCIVSESSSLPEVYKKSVWYINPTDYNNINLDNIMCGEVEDNSIILDEYSWKISAEKLKKLLFNYS